MDFWLLTTHLRFYWYPKVLNLLQDMNLYLFQYLRMCWFLAKIDTYWSYHSQLSHMDFEHLHFIFYSPLLHHRTNYVILCEAHLLICFLINIIPLIYQTVHIKTWIICSTHPYLMIILYHLLWIKILVYFMPRLSCLTVSKIINIPYFIIHLFMWNVPINS